MRAPVLLLACLAAVPAAAAAEPALRVARLPLAEVGYAEWLPDGSGFYVVSNEKLWRFDADGHPRGARPLTALGPDTGVHTQLPVAARRGLSPDGQRLALLVMDSERFGTPFIVDLARGDLKRLVVADGYVAALEWTADGHLIGASMPGGRFMVDGAGAVKPLCPALGGFAVHVRPDGRRLAFGADKLYLTDGDCDPRAALSPWHDAPGSPTWVREFAFSPSGTRVAVWAGVGFAFGRLWVLSLDGREHVDTGVAPEAGSLTWLDEETVVVSVPNGPIGTSQHTLQRVQWRTRTARPLVPPKATCNDAQASAPARGGRLVFQRLCDDPKDSFMGLVRAK